MQTNEAKSAIFEAIRRNLATSKSFDAVHEAHQIHQQKIAALLEEDSFVENAPIVLAESDNESLIDSFRKNLESVGGNVLSVNNKTEAAGEIRKVIEKINAQKIAVSDAPLIAEIKNMLGAKIETQSGEKKKQ